MVASYRSTFGALELVPDLLIADGPVEEGDRAIARVRGDHADLDAPGLRANIRPPGLGVDTVRRAHLPAVQQLAVVAAGTLEVVADAPRGPLLVLS
jgi:hypothetical protein